MAIGQCGHYVSLWPIVALKGEPPKVICDTCTAESLGDKPDTEYAVWVRFKEPVTPQTKAKRAARKAAPPKVRCSICHKQGHVYKDCPLITERLV